MIRRSFYFLQSKVFARGRTRNAHLRHLVFGLALALSTFSLPVASPNAATQADDAIRARFAKLPICKGGVNTVWGPPPGPPNVEGACRARGIRVRSPLPKRTPPSLTDITALNAWGYHHVAVESLGSVTQLEATIQVQNPDTSQCGTGCMVAAWVMMLDRKGTPDPGDDTFNQTGWIENKWNPGNGLVRQVFTYNSITDMYTFFPEYTLVDGQSYTWAEDIVNGVWNNWIFHGGVWNLLDFRSAPGFPYRGVQSFEHWMAQDGTAHATTPTIQFSDSKITPVGGVFQLWDTSVPSGTLANPPFRMNMQTQFHLWQAF